MSLADEIAQRKAQACAGTARRVDPELEAELDRFIAENPRLRERCDALSKDELVRKLVFTKMERAEMAVARNREIEVWVKENPEIIAKIAHLLKKTGAGNRPLPSGVISASLP